MRKLRKILCLLFIVGIVASMPFETAMAASRSEDFTTESASEENKLSIKQLVSDMESGKVECVLWNEVKHFGDDEPYRKKNEYEIWINDTYSAEGYNVKEEVYQVIRVQAIKNDIGLIEIPIGGDTIKKEELDNIIQYEKIECIEAEQCFFKLYNYSVKTNLGNINIVGCGMEKLSKIQSFASKYGLSVKTTNLARITIESILFVIFASGFGVCIIWNIVDLSIREHFNNKNYSLWDSFDTVAVYACIIAVFSFLAWTIMMIVDAIIS